MTKLVYDEIVDGLLKICNESEHRPKDLVVKVTPKTYEKLRTEGVKVPDFENKYNQLVEYDRSGDERIHRAKVIVRKNLSQDWIIDEADNQ